MNKKDLATQIFNDLVDEYYFNELIENKDAIIKSIEGRLSSYLIIEGGNILKNDNGKVRI